MSAHRKFSSKSKNRDDTHRTKYNTRAPILPIPWGTLMSKLDEAGEETKIGKDSDKAEI